MEEHYKFYETNSDDQIIETYLALMKRLQNKKYNEDQFIDLTNRLTAIMKVSRERNLNLEQHLQAQAISDQKDNSKKEWNNYISDGLKSLFIGLPIFGIGLGLALKSQGNVVFYGAIGIGALKMLQGAITLIAGLYLRLRYTNKF